MSQRTRMRINPPQPKITWKTVAVTGSDPLVFARNLEAALQEMTDGGYSIVSQQTRGESNIITGQRVEHAVHEGTFAMGAPPPRQRRLVQPPPKAHSGEEVLYHYIEHGKQKQKSFSTLVEALRLVQDHLRTSPITGDDPITPISLVTLATTTFELTAIPFLLRSFADELRTPKPLE